MASKGRTSGSRKGKGKRKAVAKESQDSGVVATGRDAVVTGIGNVSGVPCADGGTYDFGDDFAGLWSDEPYEEPADWSDYHKACADVAAANAAIPDPGTDSGSSVEGDQDWRHSRLAFLRDQWERAERIRGLACAFQKEIDQEEMWLRGNRYAKRPSYADGAKS